MHDRNDSPAPGPDRQPGLRFSSATAPSRAVAATAGAFVNQDPVHLQSTGFVLDPAGRVTVGVYSSGVIGRLVPTMSSASSAT